MKLHEVEWKFGWLPAVQAFRRGFVEELTLSAELLATHSAEIFEQMPFRWAHLTGLDYDQTWDWKVIARLEGIEFRGRIFGRSLGRLPPELPRLRWLKTASLEGASDLLRAAKCPRLDAIDLSGARAAPPAFENFIREVKLNGVRAFALDASDEGFAPFRMRATGARLLAESGMTELRQLHLRGQLIGEAGLYHLSHSASFQSLEELYLDRNDIGLIGPTGLEDLCSSMMLPHLRVLSLNENPIGAAGVAELAGWPGLRKLRWLDLTRCGLNKAEVKPLANSPYFHNSLWLRLDGNDFDSDDSKSHSDWD
jgi:hypothetical protein